MDFAVKGKSQTVLRLLVTLLGLSVGTELLAQRMEIRVPRGSLYAGEPIAVQVIVNGFDEEPEPSCTFEQATPGIQVKLRAVNPSVSSFTQNLNGRITQRIQVEFNFVFVAIANKAGEYTIGPFTARQGSKKAVSQAVTLKVEEIENDPNMDIAIQLEASEIYPGQRVPVTIQWSYAGDVSDISNVRIHSELFDQFEFLNDPVSNSNQGLLVSSTTEEVRLTYRGEKKIENGRTIVQLTTTRTLVADRPGNYEFPAPVTTARKVTQWRNSFFGREPARIEPLRAVGEPLSLKVKPLPSAGKPASFAGAVGTGFTLDAAADRTVVRVGDPIGLKITLRGSGNLDTASLPLLSDSGLSPDRFRLPDEQPAGITMDGQKVFEVSVRVTDPSVTQIPELAYSWFNPVAAAYETATSKPIALSVKEGRTVTASDVVGSPLAAEADADASAAPAEDNRTVAALTTADLAIETRPARLLAPSRGRFADFRLHLAIYVIGLAIVMLAVLDRRRLAEDPAEVRRRKAIKRLHERLQRAATLTGKEAATEIAAALRELIVHKPDVPRNEIDHLLADCETLIYAPQENGSQRIDDMTRRAEKILSEVAGS